MVHVLDRFGDCFAVKSVKAKRHTSRPSKPQKAAVREKEREQYSGSLQPILAAGIRVGCQMVPGSQLLVKSSFAQNKNHENKT